MAAPDHVTLRNLSGTFVLNKTLSDSMDSILAMQGVSWLIRQGIKWSTITIHVKEYVDEATGLVHIDIEQESSAGQTNSETRTLNWTFTEKSDPVFGKVRGRSRFINIDDEDLKEPYLKQGWDGKFLDESKGELVQAYVESVGNKWVANQTWGFEIIHGQRMYTRHVYAYKGKEEHRIKMVYDWKN